MAERGHTYEDVLAAINSRKPDFQNYIEPQREFADVVLKVPH
ncbi:MAG: phosphoribulokinase, partial [Cyanobacteria bacterium J06636_27]